MEINTSSRYLSRRNFLVKGVKALAALGFTGVLGRQLSAQDAALWSDTMELSILLRYFRDGF